ncbi:MAG: hypothetical protein JHC84_20835 [Solirubrobacteraceae bacterium]|nr:hypothetical protein [Solirubrobacteraceae bacterium]
MRLPLVALLCALLMTAAPATAAPVNTAPPQITGTVVVGATVTCAPGAWTGNGAITRAYRWVVDGRGGDPYVGTGATYVPVPADEGWPLQCEETATDADGSTPQNSSAVMVGAPGGLTNVTGPRLDGSPTVGQTLTCLAGTWTVAADFSYTWLRDGVPIAGAAGETHEVGADDFLRTLSCRVTATGRYVAQTATAESDSAPIVSSDGRAITPRSPAITGDARIGGRVRCVPDPVDDGRIEEPTWHLVGGTLDVPLRGGDVTVPIGAGGYDLVCRVTTRAGAGSRSADSAAVRIAPLRGLPGLPPFEQGPIQDYLDRTARFRMTATLLSYRPPQTRLLPAGDVRVTGVELTQATQRHFTAFGAGGLPNRCVADPVPWIASICPPGQPVKYAGVKLVAGRGATARVFLDRAGPARTSAVRVLVVARSSTGAEIGRVRKTVRVTQKVRADAPRHVTDAQRRDARASVNVAVPASWMRAGQMAFEASVVPVEEACAVGDCTQNNRFLLVGVPVHDTGILRLRTVRVEYVPAPPATLRETVTDSDLRDTRLDDARRMLPVRDIEVPATDERAQIDTSTCEAIVAVPSLYALFGFAPNFAQDCRGELSFAELTRRADAAPGWRGDVRAYDVLLGVGQVKDGYARGVGSTLPSLINAPDRNNRGPVTFIDAARPRTTLAHELMHNTGAQHASPCGGAANAESWPPDQVGRLQGVGWRGGTVLWDGPGATNADGFYDALSYCASEDNAWVSPKSWDEMASVFQIMRERADQRRLRTAAPRAAGGLTVSVLAGAGGGVISGVSPSAIASPVGTPSGLTVRALGAGGAVIAQADALATPANEGDGSARLLVAHLPGSARAAARMDVVRADGTVTHGQDRPAAPRVTLSAVRARANGTVPVRWRATEPGRAELTVSADGGRSWRTAWSGPAARGAVTLTAEQVPRARRARVRITVTAGWTSAAATSLPFAAPGRPPVLQLLELATRAASGERVALEARASDDAGRVLDRTSLTWFDGTRRIASGARTVSPPLAAGTHVIRVVARDRHGRTVSRRRTVRVTTSPPDIANLRIPAAVARGARTVTVRIATTSAARLTVLGQRFRVGPRPRTITVRLPARGSEILLRLVLRAGGRTGGVTASVVRG